MYIMRWPLLLLALLVDSAFAGTVASSISFVPPNPTSSDSVTAYLNDPGCGTSTAKVDGFQITATTVPGQVCFTGPPIAVTLGRLPAGSYQMQWFFSTLQLPIATAPLLVTQGVALGNAPMLGMFALLLLLLGCALLAWRALRRQRT